MNERACCENTIAKPGIEKCMKQEAEALERAANRLLDIICRIKGDPTPPPGKMADDKIGLAEEAAYILMAANKIDAMANDIFLMIFGG